MRCNECFNAIHEGDEYVEITSAIDVICKACVEDMSGLEAFAYFGFEFKEAKKEQ